MLVKALMITALVFVAVGAVRAMAAADAPMGVSGNLLDRLPEGADPTQVYDLFEQWTAEQGLTLYPAQEEAVIELVRTNVILATPTGSGKSLVAVAAHFAALARAEDLLHRPDQGAGRRRSSSPCARSSAPRTSA